jgi:porin
MDSRPSCRAVVADLALGLRARHKSTRLSWCIALSLVCACRALAQDAAAPSTQDEHPRSALTGNWGGVRDAWEQHGVTLDLDLTYTFQSVVGGGLEGPLFPAFSDEDDTGNTVSSNLLLSLDTEKAGLWSGGTLDVALDARAGRSVVERAGTVSAVNNDALFPNVVDRFDDEAIALTQLAYTHQIAERWSVFGGLLNTAEGDANAIAGSALSNEHFLNSALLYSLVEDATVPHVALGGGVLFEPSERISGRCRCSGAARPRGEIRSRIGRAPRSPPSGPCAARCAG